MTNRQNSLSIMCLVCASVALGATDDAVVIERIVARVNGDVITATEATGDLSDRIDQLLLVQHARDLGIGVESEMGKRIADAQRQSGLADQEEFQAWLQSQTGIPFADWKQQTRDSLLIQRLISQEVASRITIPDSAIEAYYKAHRSDFVRRAAVRLRETFTAPDDASPAAWERAQRVALGITLAAAKLGRELPLIEREQLRPEVAAALTDKNRGDLTVPVRGPDGFRLYFVQDQIAAGQATAAEARDEILDILYREKLPGALRGYLSKLRQEAYLQIREKYSDSNAAPDKDTTWKEPALLVPATINSDALRLRKRKNTFFFNR